ncbi:class I SAM-dependent methyltransferase [Pandoraea anhela]|uniref:Methyltransferase n=1 Tax=Pandoraea anhela TaxID=2508295 RepID=A0A5E4URD0_9BURK|nr:class I SAM-dependent methyltransferase [Pandoraea anhela]VVE01539.1 methyltransferase [Pandoraea anhela]
MKRCPNCGDLGVDASWNCSVCGATPRRVGEVLELAPALASANSGFRAEHFLPLAEVEERNFWFRARNRIISWAARPFMRAGTTFCEVGCGTGYVLAGLARAYPDVKFSATEIYSTALSFAATRLPSASFYQMDARSFAFADEFDVIGSFDVLEHIEEDEAVMRELHRALKSKGTLLLTVPQHPFLWSQQDEQVCHVRRYTRADIRAKLERNGFRVTLATSFVSLLFPAMLASRKRSRIDDAEYDMTADLRLSPPVNAIMGAVMALEFGMIQLGVRFPFGGSLLIVAQKTS